MPLGTASTLRAIALGMGGLAALVAAVEFAEVSFSEKAGPTAVTEKPTTDEPGMGGPAGTLASCRIVTPNDRTALEACRVAWEEARRRFFGLPSGTAVGPWRPAGAE